VATILPNRAQRHDAAGGRARRAHRLRLVSCGRLASATVTIHDGPNAGKSTASDGAGNYAFTGLSVGNGNVGVTAPSFLDDVRGIAINGSNTLNFTLRTAEPWSQRGTGATVFDKPAYVTRVRDRRLSRPHGEFRSPVQRELARE
jgi:hypothetical protein